MGSGNQALQGAAGGAMTGAALGSVVPGIGTGIGALAGGALGGLAGYFGDSGQQGYQDQLKQLAAGYGRRTAPQAGPAAQAAYSGFRQNQGGLIAQLEAMARGEGPSAATMQMREAMDRAAGAQASAAAGAGGRGVNSGAAYRNAANNTAAIQSQGARDTGLMRVNEQLGAIGQLGQTIAQGRAGDEGINQFNAGQQNQNSQFNVQAQLQQLGLNDEAQLRALMGAMGAAGPGLGTQLLAGGATAFPLAAQMGGKKPGMSPIAAGNPGAGGYYTPTNPYQPPRYPQTDYTGASG